MHLLGITKLEVPARYSIRKSWLGQVARTIAVGSEEAGEFGGSGYRIAGSPPCCISYNNCPRLIVCGFRLDSESRSHIVYRTHTGTESTTGSYLASTTPFTMLHSHLLNGYLNYIIRFNKRSIFRGNYSSGRTSIIESSTDSFTLT